MIMHPYVLFKFLQLDELWWTNWKGWKTLKNRLSICLWTESLKLTLFYVTRHSHYNIRKLIPRYPHSMFKAWSGNSLYIYKELLINCLHFIEIITLLHNNKKKKNKA